MIFPTASERESYLHYERTLENHRMLFEKIEALHVVENGGRSQQQNRAIYPLTVMSWNMERGRYGDKAAELLGAHTPDIVLLTEMDIGMARSGQLNTIGDLSSRLDFEYLYGTEFVELSLGDENEQAANKGHINEKGLHGNAILSRFPLHDPCLIRLEKSGKWFVNPWSGQVRIGGRMAIAARVEVNSMDLVVVSVHIESHSTPEDRALTTKVMLDTIDKKYGYTIPVIIGGDFNTNTISNRDEYSPELKRKLINEKPDRFVRPDPWEPLFEQMENHQFKWDGFNVEDQPTQRHHKGSADVPLQKLDWFFARFLVPEETQVVEAVDEQGRLLSDHELLKVIVRGQ